ncbi:response regulator transcription factor [Alkalicoccobacillus murimartini]|uniref:CheY-like chemotaxis protein n=1 Tax=Alkalicoccobacillus murimartini TaxID=171685 RepID=A0ABT9YD24_9BACI|nr:response regulator [Alkalicoccobacillus murimartini]MDQ0205745.1 CheY-like chemotaxis protein [Alkalicoccobacillus murimartini]
MKKILVADDEEVLRMLITDTLEDLECEVIEAADGQEAMDLIQKHDFDLLVLDYMMPEMTGLEVIERVRKMEHKKHVLIMMLTAKSQQADQDKMMRIGADFFLAKPFSPIVLIDRIEEILQ